MSLLQISFGATYPSVARRVLELLDLPDVNHESNTRRLVTLIASPFLSFLSRTCTIIACHLLVKALSSKDSETPKLKKLGCRSPYKLLRLGTLKK